jgi:hypothetical protein
MPRAAGALEVLIDPALEFLMKSLTGGEFDPHRTSPRLAVDRRGVH